MKLVLSKDKYKYEDDFFYWLLKYLKNYLLLKVNYSKLASFQNTLNNNKDYYKINNTTIVGKNVFLGGVNNLTLLNFENEKIIQIRQSELYPGTQLKISTLCRMINYGTLTFQAYPIFTDSFDYIEKNIKVLYLMYKRQNE